MSREETRVRTHERMRGGGGRQLCAIPDPDSTLPVPQSPGCPTESTTRAFCKECREMRVWGRAQQRERGEGGGRSLLSLFTPPTDLCSCTLSHSVCFRPHFNNSDLIFSSAIRRSVLHLLPAREIPDWCKVGPVGSSQLLLSGHTLTHSHTHSHTHTHTHSHIQGFQRAVICGSGGLFVWRLRQSFIKTTRRMKDGSAQMKERYVHRKWKCRWVGVVSERVRLCVGGSKVKAKAGGGVCADFKVVLIRYESPSDTLCEHSTTWLMVNRVHKVMNTHHHETSPVDYLDRGNYILHYKFWEVVCLNTQTRHNIMKYVLFVTHCQSRDLSVGWSRRFKVLVSFHQHMRVKGLGRVGFRYLSLD